MDDLISRRKAIDALNVGTELLRRVLDNADIVGVERAKFEWGLVLIESCISDIKDLPSAQPERKKGEWLPDFEYDGEDEYCFKECSLCKYRSEEYFNFCPNCGAKMEES